MSDGSWHAHDGADAGRNSEARLARNVLAVIFLAAALALSWLSLLASRVSSWGELTVQCCFNFFVIGFLWAAVPLVLRRRGSSLVPAVVAFVLPAAMLSLFQVGVTHVRFTIPKRALTEFRMRSCLGSIHEYMKSRGALPSCLKELPAETLPATVDAWGRDLQYSIDKEGVITLTSFGADRQPGGDGADADVVMRWRTRHADGELNVDAAFPIKEVETGATPTSPPQPQ